MSDSPNVTLRAKTTSALKTVFKVVFIGAGLGLFAGLLVWQAQQAEAEQR